MRITVSNVEYSMRNSKILNGISCSFSNGITYIVGNNGAGKTAFLKLLATAQQPEYGEINYSLLVKDKQIGTYRRRLNIEEIRKFIGFLPQQFTGHLDMTVERYIKYIAYHKGIPRELMKKTLEHWLKECKLTAVRRKKIKHLSGGQRQKVGLIQALINLPRICILDEPFESLDLEERIYFQRLLERLSHHSIVIISTHLIEEIQRSSENSLLFLNEGKITYFGDIGAIDRVTQQLQTNA